ncbi:LTA synthase family protein [Oceanobacillus chungangensis]|uniref:Sulfatase N-terminal domain-containing protein n=1 Tax=Oceanobacillus chungangensis TaxID=1229152 RepID=A0A3D8Q249_9BACI|nr:LTA synthase family protein [Oceanobacillus chungangensis]RDW21927.1 hypothetical protein CWR45_00095 [Oceanobacillus chungangensis]
MELKSTRLPLYAIATVLFGLKTYLVYRFMFAIELDNFLQEIILFINPFVSAFLLFAISVWFKTDEKQLKYIRYSALIASFIIFANLVFYRQFDDFITLPQLFQGSNMADLGSSILTLIKIYDIFLFTDVLFIWIWSRKNISTLTVTYNRRRKAATLTLSLLLIATNFLIAESSRPQLFTRGFDREYLVRSVGLFNYHVYDIIAHSKAESRRAFADGNELLDVQEYIEENVKQDENSNLYGAAKNKNIIFINAESLQQFVIHNEVNGEEVTPFLNRLINDEDTYYFDNFYEQTGQGNTADSEFLVENSLYPLDRGAVFFTHGGNDFNAIPEIIDDEGYESYVFHSNNKSFWNREQMYESLGIDYFYSEEAFDVTEDNSIGWGLKDKPFFEQSIPYLQSLEQPFYAKFITLTNHFPFDMDEADKSIEPYHSNSDILNNYFPAVRYMDEALEDFYEKLKETGLYENSIFVIMGDHIGISANHNEALSMYLDKDEITPIDQLELQRVPFIVHIPGNGNGKVISEVTGQIDVKPTLLNLLGIDAGYDIQFGNDLFADNRKGYIALRNGDFISEEFIYTNGSCYLIETGEQIDVTEKKDYVIPEREHTLLNACNKINEKVKTELKLSDDLIYGDLFRFINFDKKG